MVESRVLGRRRGIAVATFFLAAAALLTSVGPADADVTAVQGSAFGYQANVSLFGGPTGVRGFGQYPCTFEDPPGPPAQPDLPLGCTRANSGLPFNQPYSASESPSVVLPSAGGNLTQTDPDGARGTFGPAALFSGRWPDNVAQAPPSGPITVSSQGTLGPAGSVTSSVDIVLHPTPVVVPCAGNPPPGTVCTSPGGIGPGPVEADEVHSTCTATETGVTGSATFVNGVIIAQNAAGQAFTEPIPNSPPPNYTRTGVVPNVGDSFTVVFNEQIVNPDGSLTVNAVHMYLEGPTAVGDMIIGSVTCGVTAVGTTTTTAPTTTSSSTTTTTLPPTTTTSTTTTTLPPTTTSSTTTTTRPPTTTSSTSTSSTTTPSTLPTTSTSSSVPSSSTTVVANDCAGLAPTITGTPGADNITGTPGPDVIAGLGGDDTINGLGGNDTICGNDGNDTIGGDSGDDTIRGGGGDDTLTGGGGDDNVHGGRGDDTINGNDGNDRVFGNEGSDTVTGGGGNDFVSGGDDNDFLNGGAGDDTVEGNSGNDRVLGNAGNDILEGNRGADTLNSIQGDLGGFADTLNGGGDADQCFSDPSDTPAGQTGADC